MLQARIPWQRPRSPRAQMQAAQTVRAPALTRPVRELAPVSTNPLLLAHDKGYFDVARRSSGRSTSLADCCRRESAANGRCRVAPEYELLRARGEPRGCKTLSACELLGSST